MATGIPHHLLFFTSERSGPARRMESLLAQLAHRERGRLRVSPVHLDASPALARHFGVTEVPTLVLLAGDTPVARLEGRASAPEIEALLSGHLPAGNPNPSLAA
ncbi:MAG TPA: thioredoxin domain-containing protein [Gaiellaceae bacterium]|nr:thioredoxin domain-containing protein [Gaiellaceae bacterium]